MMAEAMTELEIEFKNSHLCLQEVKEETVNGVPVGIVIGLAATFDRDRGDDVIMPGAFARTIEEHNANDERPIRMFFQHRSEFLIGQFPIVDVKETAEGLQVRGEINLDVAKGRESFSLAKQGVLSDFSIGFIVREDEVREGIRFIKRVELFEISLVGTPMNPNAKITEVKSDGTPMITLEDVDELVTIRGLEEILKKSGAFSNKAIDRLAHFAKTYQPPPRQKGVETYGADYYDKSIQELRDITSNNSHT